MTVEQDRVAHNAAMELASKHRELGALKRDLILHKRDVWEQTAHDNCSVTERRETCSYAVAEKASVVADCEGELEALKVEYDVAKLLRAPPDN